MFNLFFTSNLKSQTGSAQKIYLHILLLSGSLQTQQSSHWINSMRFTKVFHLKVFFLLHSLQLHIESQLACYLTNFYDAEEMIPTFPKFICV